GCGHAPPANTLADHDLVATLTDEARDGWQVMRVSNHGTKKVAVVELVSSLVLAEKGKVASLPSTATATDAVRAVEVDPGASALVKVRLADTTCREPRVRISG